MTHFGLRQCYGKRGEQPLLPRPPKPHQKKREKKLTKKTWWRAPLLEENWLNSSSRKDVQRELVEENCESKGSFRLPSPSTLLLLHSRRARTASTTSLSTATSMKHSSSSASSHSSTLLRGLQRDEHEEEEEVSFTFPQKDSKAETLERHHSRQTLLSVAAEKRLRSSQTLKTADDELQRILQQCRPNQSDLDSNTILTENANHGHQHSPAKQKQDSMARDLRYPSTAASGLQRHVPLWKKRLQAAREGNMAHVAFRRKSDGIVRPKGLGIETPEQEDDHTMEDNEDSSSNGESGVLELNIFLENIEQNSIIPEEAKHKKIEFSTVPETTEKTNSGTYARNPDESRDVPGEILCGKVRNGKRAKREDDTVVSDLSFMPAVQESMNTPTPLQQCAQWLANIWQDIAACIPETCDSLSNETKRMVTKL